MFASNFFGAVKMGLASPEKIRAWSRGEVTEPKTINYRTLKPEPGGLFCERIFGPINDWQCNCGRYKRVRHRGVVCERCGVEVTRSSVRRERMGHIDLAAPVSHIWYFKGLSSPMGLLLDMSPGDLEKILYFTSYVVIDPGETVLLRKQLLTELEYRECQEKYATLFKTGKGFKAGMGAKAVKTLLEEIELGELAAELHDELMTSRGQKKVRAIRRLEMVEAFRQSGNHPSWIILEVIPIIPPDLRPMVQLDGGRFATSDLNDLYRRVINRNNRLKRLLDLGAPVIIVRNEKRMLQEAVDALIDNGRRGRPVTGPGNRPLKSLSDMLKGKEGRFRHNFLGKHVDYSGRTVITPGPELKIHQCGLPKVMALELFKPFVMRQLVKDGFAHNIKNAKRMVEKVRPEVWKVLEEVIKDHPVLLNCAPAMNRLGIQAFEPLLVKGKSIRINPLLCTAFNTCFGGDQMAVHVPLLPEAQAEARLLLLASYNILNPRDGRPVLTPIKEMVLGCYYLTLEMKGAKGEGRFYIDPEEAIKAYSLGNLDLHARVFVRFSGFVGCGFVPPQKYLLTTVGKIIFNNALPPDFIYINNADFDDPLPEKGLITLNSPDYLEVLESVPINCAAKKNFIRELLYRCYQIYGNAKTVEILDEITRLGFHYATRSGATIAIGDFVVPPNKQNVLHKAETLVRATEENFQHGLLIEKERHDQVVEAWKQAEDELNCCQDSSDRLNPVYMMVRSGAQSNESRLSQISGMYGLTADPAGNIIDQPIKNSFRKGLTALEYFNTTYGSRRELVDTALKKENQNLLTNRLVDAAQDVIIREEDCGTRQGVKLLDYLECYNDPELVREQLIGRFALESVYHPITGEVVVDRNQLIDEDKARKLFELGTTEFHFRSVLTCRSRYGVCVKCYGLNLATKKIVDVGEAVGIIAAQSIGELGAQMTRRSYAGGRDIVRGLPRLEELFEARKPKGQSLLSEVSGIVYIQEARYERKLQVISAHGVRNYSVPYRAGLKVKDGQKVDTGEELTEGSINPYELLKIKGVRSVQLYLLQEVQRVCQVQGVDINDKHIEVIIRQMLKRVKVEDPGDTELLPGKIIDRNLFIGINERIGAEGGRLGKAQPLLLGITKAALASNSFLTGASLKKTTQVLTDAAIKGKHDLLLGPKENVIIGSLIPAGTGIVNYRNMKVKVGKDSQFQNEVKEINRKVGVASYPSGKSKPIVKEKRNSVPVQYELWNSYIERKFRVWMTSKNYAVSTSDIFSSLISYVFERFKSLADIAISGADEPIKAIRKFRGLLERNKKFGDDSKRSRVLASLAALKEYMVEDIATSVGASNNKLPLEAPRNLGRDSQESIIISDVKVGIKTTIDGNTKSCVESILQKYFPNGIRPKSVIDINKLKYYCREIQGGETLLENVDITLLLYSIGVRQGEKVFYLSKSEIMDLVELLKRLIAEGNRLFFYEELYIVHGEFMQKIRIFSPELLKTVLLRVFPSLNYSSNSFTINGKTSVESEILRCYETEVCLSYEQLKSKLPYVPLDKIKQVLAQNSNFIWVETGVYTHVNKIVFDFNEWRAARRATAEGISKYGYVTLASIDVPISLQSNPYLSETAVKNGLFQACLAELYEKRGSIITPKGKAMSSVDLLSNYCSAHDYLTVDQLLEFEREIYGRTHSQSLFIAYDKMVRVDKDKFVNDSIISFDIEATDRALSLFLTRDVIPLQAVTSFISFPHIEGYPWNWYLLESYCKRFSKLFMYQCLSVNSKNVGAIFRKSAGFADYIDVLAAAVSVSNVELNDIAVGDYLFEKRYVAIRTGAVGKVVERARILRGKRG